MTEREFMSREVGPHSFKPQSTGMRLGVELLKRSRPDWRGTQVLRTGNCCLQRLIGKRESVDTEEAQ